MANVNDFSKLLTMIQNFLSELGLQTFFYRRWCHAQRRKVNKLSISPCKPVSTLSFTGCATDGAWQRHEWSRRVKTTTQLEKKNNRQINNFQGSRIRPDNKTGSHFSSQMGNVNPVQKNESWQNISPNNTVQFRNRSFKLQSCNREGCLK